ncbi:hypothetical protein GCM10007079_10680 [Nocardiopsis terrae]|nr:hypothetical protein GCM10007079_10680 [Nocardiopsis terrae]
MQGDAVVVTLGSERGDDHVNGPSVPPRKTLHPPQECGGLATGEGVRSESQLGGHGRRAKVRVRAGRGGQASYGVDAGVRAPPFTTANKAAHVALGDTGGTGLFPAEYAVLPSGDSESGAGDRAGTARGRARMGAPSLSGSGGSPRGVEVGLSRCGETPVGFGRVHAFSVRWRPFGSETLLPGCG